MLIPKLNYLKTSEIYHQVLELAKVYCPEWAKNWPAQLDTNVDPGLTVLRLFADLAEHVIKRVNQMPDQRFLAYLNFMGLGLGYPLAATVPLSFILNRHSTGTVIPLGTAVAQKDNPKLLFYTEEDLTVLPLSINVALYIDPDQDAYLDQSQVVNNDQTSFNIFDDQDSQPLNHMLLLGDSNLFTPNAALQEVEIILIGSNLYQDYFSQWFDDLSNPLEVQSNEDVSKKELIIKLQSLPAASTYAMPVSQVLTNLLGSEVLVGSKITDNSSSEDYYWLAIKPAQGIKILNNYKGLLPQISTIICKTAGANIIPDITLYNNIILDAKNGMYPFSQMPQSQDAFYIGSSDVFNRPGASITLQFSINPAVGAFTIPPTLAWEFWNGQAWENFTDSTSYSFVDQTNNFTATTAVNSETCTVSFICPTMKALTIAGQSSFWIRARIANGDYSNTSGQALSANIGKIPTDILPNSFKENVIEYLNQSSLISQNSTTDIIYYPPFIYSLTIGYEYTSSVDQCLIHNNFETADLLNFPYIPIQGQFPAFYLGLQLQSKESQLNDENINLFFAIEQSLELTSDFNFNLETSPISWKYYNGYNWVKLAIVDNTFGLMKSGIVSFRVPNDWQQSNIFGQNLLWLKIENQYSSEFSVLIAGIYPNSVMATNAKVIDHEILGSGTGQASQVFKFSHKNILIGQKVAVIESKLVNQEEMLQLAAVSGADAVSEVEIHSETYIQIVWQEVDNFLFSTPTNRHYVLNHQTGEIYFGNGVHGMVVPKGTHNVIALSYQTTFGIGGNSSADSLVRLQKANSQIKTVINHITAVGGSNGYELITIKQQGPKYLKTYDRAVLRDDYSALAIQASPLVLKAATQKNNQGEIIVYILPDIEDDRPLPDYNLLQTVKDYISQRVFLPLKNKIVVHSPNYVVVNVVVQCYVTPGTSAQNLKNLMMSKLTEFLNPCRGNLKGQGWDFGEDLLVVNLISYLQHINGIDRIASVSINGNTENLGLTPDQLISCGTITVLVL